MSSDDELRALLADHFASEAEAECARVGKLHLWMGGDRSDAVRAAVDAHCATCATCRQALADFEAVLAAGALDEVPPWDAPVPDLSRHGLPAAPVRPRAPPTRRPRRAAWAWGLAASALIGAGAAGIALVGSRPEHPGLIPKGTYAPDADATASVGADRLEVVLRRDGLDMRAEAGDQLAVGDRLGFVYSAATPGFLQVFDVEPGAAPVLLYPVALDDGAIVPGTDRPLATGALVGSGNGCEWYVAVFSDTRLDAATTARDLDRARTADLERCTLDAELPTARGVVVIGFRR